eukprot:71552_1
MLSKVRRIGMAVRIKQIAQPLHMAPIMHSNRFIESTMYCMQCEQTSHGTGCTAQGICGKWPETANMQDLLSYVNLGLCQYIHGMGEDKLDPEFKEKIRHHVLESMFSTITNVNFSEERIIQYIKGTLEIREQIQAPFRQIFPDTQEFESIANSPSNYVMGSPDELNKEAQRLASLYATKELIGDANCFGLRECAMYGLKGAMGYFHHAELLHHTTPNGTYSTEERDEIYATVFETMNDLTSTSKDLNFWLGICMRIGAMNVKVMEVLDRSHNTLYGSPTPTEVSTVPVPGKAILMSGHDILPVQRVLDLIEKKGLDINVYTHGELQPAHMYPELHKNKRLVGNYGAAWQNQYKDFKSFPGAILMTTNCMMPPRTRYKSRFFTTGCVGYDEVKHIDCDDETDLMRLLDKAMECDGFDEKTIAPWKESKPFLVGFGRDAILSHAETIVGAIESGALKHVFVIGGCDGNEKSRSYFTDLADITPDNSIILTLGCCKFRFRGLEFGDIGGIPRVLDMGQCNDAYGAVVVALKLAEALETDVHSLPLHFAVSWFEQKAVAIFLSLLHLGIKNIHLGPELPAFLTEDVRKYLFDNMGVQQINFNDVNEELKTFLAETPGAK